MHRTDPGNSLIRETIEQLQMISDGGCAERAMAHREQHRLTLVKQLTQQLRDDPISATCAAHLIVDLALGILNKDAHTDSSDTDPVPNTSLNFRGIRSND